jgi:1,2-phenylacetyl-CoA epoxidase PaaB subunit
MATGQLYEVFARRTRDEPLGHVGTVNATSTDFARVYARTTYDEENWIEMVVVERAAMIPVIELEPLVEFKEAE